MTKNRAFWANKIALFLAVMLMFSAFCTGGVTAFDSAYQTKGTAGEAVLGSPGAGEFFTGSLPAGERQSVREVSTEWQIVQGIRQNRADGFKNGSGGNGACIVQPGGQFKLHASGENQGAETGESPPHFRDVIVCYIHNQDGQKG